MIHLYLKEILSQT